MWRRSLPRVSLRTLAKATSSLHIGRFFCSGNSNSPHWAMANVTRSNFKSVLEELRTLVRDANFIAIDLEMSGITSAPWRENFEFDTLDVRYSKLKDSAEKFAVLQFGVCPFRWDSAKEQFLAHPYNFYIFPRNELPVDFPSFDFLCQTTSLEFLAKHHFDFNVCIYEGISYLSKQQEAEVRLKLGLTNVDENKSSDSERCMKDVRDIPLTSISDVLFSERMKIKFGSWRDNLLRDQSRGQHAGVDDSADCNMHLCESETSFYKKRPSLLLNGLNSHQIKLVQQALRRYFKDLMYIETIDSSSAIKNRVLFIHSEEDRKLLMRELDEERHMALETEVEHSIGFRHVIDLIVSAGKIIVGHNCLLDFAHIHSKFIGPLPEHLVDFATSLHNSFPYIIDTKYLLKTQPTLQNMMKNKSTSLSFAFTHMCGQTACTSEALNIIKNSNVKITVPTELQRYTDAHGSAKHEAGYDAYMTGFIFAQACNHLDVDFNKIHLGSDLAMTDTLENYVNLLYLGWIKSVVLDLTTGRDATESRPMIRRQKFPSLLPSKLVLVWGFQTGYSCSDLRGFVSGVLGSASPIIEIFFLDATSAFIYFRNEHEAAEFLQLIEHKMAETYNSLSSESPLSSLLEAGCISAVGYPTYEKICKSSLSKLFFAEQAEALGLGWKINASLENEKKIKNVNLKTESIENLQTGHKMGENPQDHPKIDETETSNGEKRQERSFPCLSEDKLLDIVRAPLGSSGKRPRTER